MIHPHRPNLRKCPTACRPCSTAVFARHASRRSAAVTVAIIASGCFPSFHAPSIPPPNVSVLNELARAADADPTSTGLHVTVDTSREAVVIVAGPFRLAPAHGSGAHSAHSAMDLGEHSVARLRFDWPVTGWVRGYQLDVFDASGKPADPSFVHHFVVTNFDRRQLIYPTAEKLVGIGRETGSVDLPVSLGVPLAPGYRMGMLAGLHNAGDDEAEIFLRLILRWTAADGRRTPRAVMPINLDVNNVVGSSSAYDLPGGRSSRAYEFEVPLDGRLLGLSGHLHDHGLAVRLEDVETSRTIAEVRGILDQQGRIVRVDQKKWIGLFGRGIPLRGGRRYRLVADYDSPARDTLRSGAMGQMMGVFAPDDWSAWPRVDAGDRDYRKDAAAWQLDLSTEEFMRTGADSLQRHAS